MEEFVRWLRAQIDADARVAEAATDGPWIAEVSGETGNCVIPADAQSTREYVARTQLYAAVFDAQHIAEWDPARVLREIEAKRKLLYAVVSAKHDYNHWHARPPADRDARVEVLAKMTARWAAWKFVATQLAAPYADREGYAEALAALG